jgi:hypothetical protein
VKILSALLTDTTTIAALAAALDIPIHTGLQHQGDVSVVPDHMARDAKPATTPVPLAGVPVVRGESGGNTHLLLADGPVMFDAHPASPSDLTLGCLTVPVGSVAYLDHPEHGNSGIGPGTYALRRKREQADELRLVAD